MAYAIGFEENPYYSRPWLSLLGFLAVVLVINMTGSFAIMHADSGWYRALVKPDWIPPMRVFGPVWTTLYLMVAVAGWRVWEAALRQRFSPLSLRASQWYLLQLALNLLWPVCFFYYKALGVSLIDNSLLLLAILMTIIHFYRIDKTAAWLMVPYFIWVEFAVMVNSNIYAMNPVAMMDLWIG